MLSKLSIENYKPAVKQQKKVRPERELSEGKFGPKANFTKVPNRILDDPLMSAKEKIVLIALYRHSFDKGVCDPRVKILQRETGIRRDTIYKILQKLESQHYIKKFTRHGHSTLYKLSSFGN